MLAKKDTAMAEPVNIGLIGAGIWMQDAYVPTMQTQSENFNIVAVYNRTLSKAEALAKSIGAEVRATGDVESVLRDDNIDAVAIALPVAPMPGMVQRALEAGKHVLSEKPISGTVAEGKKLLEVYAGRQQQVWMIGEQWRFEDAFVKAGDMIRNGEIGEIRFAQWAVFNPFNESSKYYHTDWRRNRSFPGGIIMDAFVHRVAGLRMTLGDVVSVQATIVQQRDDTPPADTLSATFTFENGAIGNFGATYNSPLRRIQPLTIVGSHGLITVDWHNLTLQKPDGDTVIPVEGGTGLQRQFAAFASAIQTGEPHPSTAIEALRDVAVMEALLHSGTESMSKTVDKF